MDSGNFTYRPLTESDSIRLIVLQPASAYDSPIQCSILHTTLSECERDIIDQFTALSYVWGPPTQTGTITLDGHTVTIGASLACALRNLRDLARAMRLWTDALCIDQSNFDERDSQVNLMGEIYSTANHTVIHMNPHPSVSSSYIDVLQALRSNTSGQVLAPDAHFAQLASRTILRDSWFNRVWVFQELVLSRDPWVQNGTLRAKWSDLCSRLLNPSADAAATRPKELQVLADMDGARGHPQSLFRYLSSRRGLGATNPLDIIYSHLGVISDREAMRFWVPIDYQKSCAEIYECVARYILENIGPEGPDIFFRHASANHLGKHENLASWAPDWSLPDMGLSEMYRDSHLDTKKLKQEEHFAFVGNPMLLSWFGYQVDVVTNVCLPFPANYTPALDGDLDDYQDIVTNLELMYIRGFSSSGDEFGQYTHWDVGQNQGQHTLLSKELAQSWLSLLSALILPANLTTNPTIPELETHGRFVLALKTWLHSQIESPNLASPRVMVGFQSSGLLRLMYEYRHSATENSVLVGRRMCSTKSGKIGVVPAQTRIGDSIVYLAGMEIALVLRPAAAGGLTGGEKIKRREMIMAPFRERRESITQQLVKDGIQSKLDDLEVLDCTLVGEGYLDGVGGWRMVDAYHGVKRGYAIYAMR